MAVKVSRVRLPAAGRGSATAHNSHDKHCFSEQWAASRAHSDSQTQPFMLFGSGGSYAERKLTSQGWGGGV